MRLYIHWPFCRSRCAYCDFNTRIADRRVVGAYAHSLRRELAIWSMVLSRQGGLRSLYLGGGTPSTMRGDEVAQLLSCCRGLFPVRGDAEVTVEVNPATWNGNDYQAARKGGVNRVSIGVQSLDDRVLRALGRPHGAEDAAAAVRNAQRAGLAPVSIDLMFGLPVEFAHRFGHDLERAIYLQPQHISIYALTLSSRTRMGRSISLGELHLPEDDDAAEEYLGGARMLREAGYSRYEISNFCMPGYECRHNLAYWKREDCLGTGAGAHSLIMGWRFRNPESILAYNRRLQAGSAPVFEASRLTESEERSERIMLGLRMARGVPEALLGATERLGDLEDYGLIRRERRRVRLTEKGMLLSNPVIAELLPA